MADTKLTQRSDGQAFCPNSVTSAFAGRGLARTVRRDAEEQQARETETRVEAPLAYRLSDMDENGVNAYRINGEEMTEDGLLRYAGESRAMWWRERTSPPTPQGSMRAPRHTHWSLP